MVSRTSCADRKCRTRQRGTGTHLQFIGNFTDSATIPRMAAPARLATDMLLLTFRLITHCFPHPLDPAKTSP